MNAHKLSPALSLRGQNEGGDQLRLGIGFHFHHHSSRALKLQKSLQSDRTRAKMRPTANTSSKSALYTASLTEKASTNRRISLSLPKDARSLLKTLSLIAC